MQRDRPALTFPPHQRHAAVGEGDLSSLFRLLLPDDGGHSQLVVILRVGEERKVSLQGRWLHPHMTGRAAGQKRRDRPQAGAQGSGRKAGGRLCQDLSTLEMFTLKRSPAGAGSS